MGDDSSLWRTGTVEECSFNTIFGCFQGHMIYASRKVPEKIEVQTRYAAELYNVDVRQDQRYLAEKDLFPCGERDESRFSPDFENPLSIMGMEVLGDPNFPRISPVFRYSMSASKGSRGRRRLSCKLLLDGTVKTFRILATISAKSM